MDTKISSYLKEFTLHPLLLLRDLDTAGAQLTSN